MDGMKLWQKVLLVVAAIVLVGGVWYSFRGKGPEFGDRLYFVDLASGDIYVFNLKGTHGLMIPAKNPETGQRTLIPIQIDPDGEDARISPRYQSTAEMLLERDNITLSDQIDRNSWVVHGDIRSAKKLARAKSKS